MRGSMNIISDGEFLNVSVDEERVWTPLPSEQQLRALLNARKKNYFRAAFSDRNLELQSQTRSNAVAPLQQDFLSTSLCVFLSITL